MANLSESWKKIIKEYENPTILKERLLKPYFLNLKLKEPILDIGCGTGYFTELLAERGLKIIGFDQNTINRKSKVEYIQGDTSALPFKDNSFNSILLINVLSCVDEVKKRIKILAEARRAKKKQGKIYVINTSEKLFESPTNSELLGFKKLNSKKIFISVKKTDNSKIEFEDYIITKEDINKYSKEAGLKLVEIRDFMDKEMKREIYTLYVLE